MDVGESYKSTPEDRVDVGGDIRTVEMTGTDLPRRSQRPLRRSVKGEVAGEAGDRHVILCDDGGGRDDKGTVGVTAAVTARME